MDTPYIGHNRKNLHIKDRFNGPNEDLHILTIHFEPPQPYKGQDVLNKEVQLY